MSNINGNVINNIQKKLDIFKDNKLSLSNQKDDRLNDFFKYTDTAKQSKEGPKHQYFQQYQ